MANVSRSFDGPGNAARAANHAARDLATAV